MFGTRWLEPPSSFDDVRRLFHPKQAMLLSGGPEGYLMAAVDVCVDVEALICCCCHTTGIVCSEASVPAGVVVSSLIFGESRKQ